METMVPARSAGEDVQEETDDAAEEQATEIPEDLTDLQTEVADALVEHGEQSASELQTVTGQDDNIYNRLNALNDKDLIETRDDPDDARRTLYSLTVDNVDEERENETDVTGDDSEDHRIGDELVEELDDADQEASADGGVKGKTESDLDLPGDATSEDVQDLVDALGPKPYLGEIADELNIERDKARTVVVLVGGLFATVAIALVVVVA